MAQPKPRKSTDRNRQVLFTTIGVIFVLGVGAYFIFSRQIVQVSGPMPREAYILRPAWSDAMLKSMSDHGPQFDELVVVGGEVFPENGSSHYEINRLDYKWLADHHLRVGLLMLVSAPEGSDVSADFLNCAKDMLKAATDAGVRPVELQVDFNAAKSQLPDYLKYLQQLRTGSSMPVSVILSPEMLNNGFAPAAAIAGSFVLRANASNEDLLKGVNIVSQLKLPFRLVLLSSTAKSNPTQMADLMRSLIAGRPRFLQGVIWNNFSSDDDYAVWQYGCLDAVMNGVTPQPDDQLLVRTPEKNLSEIDIVNKGTADGPFSSGVTVSWNEADLVEAKPLPDFDRADTGRRSMVFTPQPSLAGKPIRPGEQRAIGWVRLTDDSPVRAQIGNPPN